MQKTIFTILTDETVREANPIATNLDKEMAVGARWL